MNSLIFNKLSELLFIPLNLLSYYILLRGHNAPGGGFIAGLICSMSFLMIALSKGTSFARKKLYFDPIIQPIRPGTFTNLQWESEALMIRLVK